MSKWITKETIAPEADSWSGMDTWTEVEQAAVKETADKAIAKAKGNLSIEEKRLLQRLSDPVDLNKQEGDFPIAAWVVEGCLVETFGFASGPPGSTKTTGTIALATLLTGMRPNHPMMERIIKRNVIVFSEDEGQWQKNWAGYTKEYLDPESGYNPNDHMYIKRFTVSPDDDVNMVAKMMRYTIDHTLNGFKHPETGYDPLIVIDTFGSVFNTENIESFGQIASVLMALGEHLGDLPVMINHHVPKSAERFGSDPLGSVALKALVKGTYGWWRDEADNVGYMYKGKARDVHEHAGLKFKAIKSVNIAGVNKYGVRGEDRILIVDVEVLSNEEYSELKMSTVGNPTSEQRIDEHQKAKDKLKARVADQFTRIGVEPKNKSFYQNLATEVGISNKKSSVVVEGLIAEGWLTQITKQQIIPTHLA
ncbi:MAG: AAA family ATPase [Oceanospirillaceae bacterium]|nr:AAA family ATPase [Oceanospirillaceae bacterium]